MPNRPAQWHATRTTLAAAFAAALVVLAPAPARAVDALVIEARRVHGAGLELRDVVMRLEPGARVDRPRVTLQAAAVDAGPRLGTLRRLRAECAATRLDEPEPSCPRARIRIADSLLGPLAFDATLGLRTDSGVARIGGRGLSFAGGQVRFEAGLDAARWRLDAVLEGGAPQALLRRLPGAAALPAGLTLAGRIDAHLQAEGRDAPESLQLDATLQDGAFSSVDGAFAGEQIGLTLRTTLAAASAAARAGDAGALALRAELAGSSGQAVAGPTFIDLGAHPLRAEASGEWLGERVTLDGFGLSLGGLLRATGKATLSTGKAPRLQHASIDVGDVQLGPAYESFMKTTLAGTPFGQLRASGSAAAHVRIEADAAQEVELRLRDAAFADARGGGLRIDGLQGTLHWTPAGAAAPPASFLEWRSGGAYGLSGGAARLTLALHGRDVALLEPARIPIFDGGLAVREFSLREAGTEAMQLVFAGDVEPISMPLIAAAFGWPQFQGSVAGRIPRIEYRDRLLTFGGDLEARVFDGRIVGRNLRLQDPLGRWPRLFADFAIENLDLALVTQTFAIGSITGRLEGRVDDLELFAWSPVAFDAELRTPPGDRSPHRISARAIGSISNVGGGGGGVESALQSGMFRLFDTFSYDRLGIRCRLRDEVCLMSGIEPAGTGYYLMKGKGLPRVDIVGNEGRVNWPQLVSQIVAQMNSEGELRIE